MDKTLQELKRDYLRDPADNTAAGRYIASLERALGGVETAPDPVIPKRLGWECPSDGSERSGSPDGICVYPDEIQEDETGHFVRLVVAGKYVNHPVPAEALDEYWESCIFCGHPEERK